MYDHCRSHVAIQGATAIAAVFSGRERFGGNRSALRASLGSAARINLNQFNTSICSFVSKVGDDLRPRSIMDVLSEHPGRQAFDVEVFDGDPTETAHKISRDLVAQVAPTVADPGVIGGEHRDAFAARFGATLAPGNGALPAAQTFSRALRPIRPGFDVPIRQDDKAGQPQIDPDATWPSAFNGTHLNVKDDVPLAGLPCQDRGLRLAGQRTVPSHLDLAGHADKSDLARLAQSKPVADPKISGVVAVAGAKAWEPRLGTASNATEERLEALIKLAHHLLLGGTRPAANVRQFAPDLRKGCDLLITFDADALPVGEDAMLKCGVVEGAKVRKHLRQGRSLRLVGVDSVLVGEYQEAGLRSVTAERGQEPVERRDNAWRVRRLYWTFDQQASKRRF